MNDKFKKLASNTMIFAIGSIGSKFITFLLVPIYTNTLTTAEYGTTEIVVTAINLLIPFLSLSIQDAVLRFGLAPDVEAKKVIKNAVFIVGIGSIISCLLGMYRLLGAQNIVRMNINMKKTFVALILLMIESIATIGEGKMLIVSIVCAIVIFIMYMKMIKDYVLSIKQKVHKKK